MKLTRDVSGDDLVKGLQRVDHSVTRQKGDYLYMTTQRSGEHHVSIPLHNPMKVGTLSGILRSVATHL
jgi:hypothetical protein